MDKRATLPLILIVALVATLITMPQPGLGQQASTKSGSELAERLNDPRLMAQGQTRVYCGEHLTAVSLPVGGIGAGCININGKAERHSWQIFNNFNEVLMPHSFFAVRAKTESGEPVIRAMQTTAVGPFAAIDSLSFRGEFPFGWYDFEDNKLPVKISLETFNPLIPLNARDSSIPCALFNFTARNTSDKPVEVSFLATQKNAVGFSGDYRIVPPDGIVLADFESPDYGNWQVTGDAFGERPSGTFNVKGFLGKGLVNTRTQESGTGTLTSPLFTINRDYICFLVGGCYQPHRAYINLLIDDEVVDTATGPNNEPIMIWHCWDVRKYRNKQAQIQIVDKESRRWGYIYIDHIMLSDEQPSNQLLAGLGKNKNSLLKEKGAAIMHMTADKDKSDIGYGDMALVAFEDDVTAAASWDDLDVLLKDFSKDGLLSASESAGPSPDNQTLDAAIAKTFTLKPGEKRTVRFALVWHFPNAEHGTKKRPEDSDQKWSHQGNMYANWWSDALDVARYLNEHADELTRLTRLYHDTFYASNLPHWLLDRISSQIAVLRSKTCFWAKSGYFGGWEGCNRRSGSCYGNCAHVWHYAQTHARLFPSIARRMREQALQYQYDDGGISFRQPVGIMAVDGQCGEILGAYREYLTGTDSTWLGKHWPRIKKAMEYTITRWDSNETGELAGAQHNTLDADLGGSTSWLGTMYLAALQATEKMAELQADTNMAQRCRRIRESGAKKQNETLWNGEYYIQIPDPKPQHDYNTGCHIDQLLGRWWAEQLGLQPHYPPDRVRTAMKALFKYNFRTNFRGFRQKPRKFVDDNDPGLLMITWPNGGRPKRHIPYADEIWTGTEYSAAATMIQAGLLKEALVIVLAANDRYDGRLRTGLAGAGGDHSAWGYSGSPFCDEECGKFYARAMSVWSILLACQGFIYDGPAGVIGFKPVWKPHDHTSLFTAAQGWGLFSQKRNGNKQTHRIELTHGSLKLNRLIFEPPEGTKPANVSVEAAGKAVTCNFSHTDEQLIIELANSVTLNAGQALTAVVQTTK